MKRLTLLLMLLVELLAWPGLANAIDSHVVVVAHSSVRKLDLATLRRIYTGKAIVVDGMHVIPVNAALNLPLRQRFLSSYLGTAEDEYVAYWTVRRHIGKGIPPAEMRQASEIIDFVNRTPGAIAYLDEADVPRGMNVVLRN